ncbi:MAG: hypothetical protein AAF492_23760, partial [Verrucomicrobiota bacterium]
FEESVELGDRHIARGGQMLLESLSRKFEDLQHHERVRIKRFLLGLQEADWLKDWNELPLFDSTVRPCVFSLNQMRRLEEQFCGVPFIIQHNPRIEYPDCLPVIGQEELRFLQKRGFKLRPFHDAKRVLRPRRKPPEREEPEACAHLRGTEENFLAALNESDTSMRFAFTMSPTFQSDRSLLYIQRDHPLVTQSLARFQQDPDTLQLIKYKRLGLADSSKI